MHNNKMMEKLERLKEEIEIEFDNLHDDLARRETYLLNNIGYILHELEEENNAMLDTMYENALKPKTGGNT